METIKKKYIVDKKNQRVTVQVDIDTFAKFEERLENYGLMKILEEEKSEVLELKAAKEYYKNLPKQN